MKMWIRGILLWALGLVPDNTEGPKVRRFESLKGLFENPDADPKMEDRMTLEERIKRAQDVRNMILTPGFKVVEDLVSYGYKNIVGAIGNEKDPLQIMHRAGQTTGLSKFRGAVIRVLGDGERAKEELIEKNRGRKIKMEDQPAPSDPVSTPE